jgi:hypothetical protein
LLSPAPSSRRFAHALSFRQVHQQPSHLHPRHRRRRYYCSPHPLVARSVHLLRRRRSQEGIQEQGLVVRLRRPSASNARLVRQPIPTSTAKRLSRSAAAESPSESRLCVEEERWWLAIRGKLSFSAVGRPAATARRMGGELDCSYSLSALADHSITGPPRLQRPKLSVDVSACFSACFSAHLYPLSLPPSFSCVTRPSQGLLFVSLRRATDTFAGQEPTLAHNGAPRGCWFARDRAKAIIEGREVEMQIKLVLPLSPC